MAACIDCAAGFAHWHIGEFIACPNCGAPDDCDLDGCALASPLTHRSKPSRRRTAP